MSYEVAQSVCRDFLNSASPSALAINGAWGCGKTFLWNGAIAEYSTSNLGGLKKYAYVSLFGIRSIQELKALVCVRTRFLEKPNKEKKWFWQKEESIDLAGRGAISIANKTLGSEITLQLLGFSENFIKDTIICFDDFERTDWSALNVESILGLISDLKEHKRCKVVLIFNQDQLDHEEAKSKFQSFREKVIDADLVLEPKSAEIIDLSFDKTKPYFAIVEKCLDDLKLVNIRIHQRIRRLLDELYRAVPDLDINLMPSLVRALVLYAAVILDRAKNRPPLEFIRGYSAAARRGLGAIQQGDQSSLWTEQLYAYGIREFDAFDECLVKFVERGYLQGTGLLDAINDWKAEHEAGISKGAFDKAWRTFHDSLADDKDEFVDQLVRSIKVSAKSISPNNLNTTVSLLKELGREDLAPEIISAYIDQRKDEREIFELGNAPFSDQVYDDDLRKALSDHLAKIPVRLSLHDAAYYLVGRKESRTEVYAALRAATPDDFYELLKSINNSNLHSLISALLDLRGDQHLREAGENVAKAVNRLSNDSKLNELRLRRHKNKIQNVG